MARRRARRSSGNRRPRRANKRSPRIKVRRTRRRGLFSWIPRMIRNAISLIVIGILVLRFSIPLFGYTEATFWIGLIGWALVVGGVLMLIAHWRNNVSMLTTKHSVKWN